jgi:signal transduction histidine kinase
VSAMRVPARRRLTAAGVAAAVPASLGGVGVSLWAAIAARGPVLDSLLSGVVVVAFTVVGAAVIAARPGNPVGWLMLAGGTAWSLGQAGADLAYLGIVADPGRVPGAGAFGVTGSALRAVGWLVVTGGVPLYYPDGRIEGRWRRLVRVLAIAAVLGAVAPVTDPQGGLTDLGSWRNPWAADPAVAAVGGVAALGAALLGVLATAGAVAHLVVRWRRGDALVRQQVALLAAASALTLAVIPAAFLSGQGWVFSGAVLPLPVAIGFAVLARGLYDLRTAVNRTLLWLTLSAAVAGAYALVIAGVGALLHVPGAAWLPWVAAGAVAVTFAPLRDGLQRAVNRLTFGRWNQPYDVLAALGQRLEASTDVDRLLVDVVGELRLLGLEEISVADSDGRCLAGDPGGPDTVAVPLTAYGRAVGTLRYRQPAAPLRPRDLRLLDDLGGHLGGVLHAHRLSQDLQRALEAQVLAREEERRRLRRDLHDGLGPALAGHLLRLDVLAAKLPPGSPAAADADALRSDLRATVLEVRRVVEGLRPPALDELGLPTALAHAVTRLTAGSGVAVDLRTGNLPPLSAAVEVAAYRIVAEAVTNVVRHAGATTCRVTVDVAGAVLRVTVSDDGRGLDDASGGTGNGLLTMRERAAELRGRFRVSGASGTTVVAELPLPAAGRPARHPAAAPA